MGRISKGSRHPILREEHGTIFKSAGSAIALGYPAPYRVGVSSLGAQQVYRVMNSVPGLACSRFFLPDNGEIKRPLTTLETGRPVRDMEAIALSVACEQEILGVVRLLEAADLSPLASMRKEDEPPVIIGGPLTMVDPRLVAPFADFVVQGEGDHLIIPLGEALVETGGGAAAFKAEVKQRFPSIWDTRKDESPPEPTIPESLTPAFAATWSSLAELKNLFLVEASRGCRRGCTFCTMSRRAHCAPRYRTFDRQSILEVIPPHAQGVGLVGAAVSEHPDIVPLVGELVDRGQRVSLSSIRADKLSNDLVRLLKAGGLRTLTIAADGPSERLRRQVHKGISIEHLIGAAEMARSAGFQNLKVYAMVGLPGETDEDVIEFAELLRALARGIRVSTTVQTFVPKPNTPLAEEQMLDVSIADKRLSLLKRQVKGGVRVLPTSPKWSWIDWRIAHLGKKAADVALRVNQLGNRFSSWKKAIKELDD